MESPEEPRPDIPAPTPAGSPVGPTPPPGGEEAAAARQPPPPAPRPGGDDTANVGLRIGAGVLALVLALIAFAGIAAMIDVSDKGTCDELVVQNGFIQECYDFSESVKPLVLAAGWIGSILAGIAAILALAFTIRGRGGRILLGAIGAAAFFIAISIIAAQA